MPTPLVSVIIPVFNGQAFLLQTLSSVTHQTYPNIEIIVIEDGSDKSSEKIVTTFPQIQYHSQLHQGNAASRNSGINLSQGEFICFLDQDDLWPTDKIENQVKYFLKHPETQILSGLTTEFLEPGQKMPNWARTQAQTKSHKGASPGTWMVRRSFFNEVGFFKSELQAASDVEWLYRIKKLGFKICFLESVVLIKRIHNDNQSAFKNPEKVRQYHSEMLRIFRNSK